MSIDEASASTGVVVDHIKQQEKQQLLDILSSDNKTFEQCLQQFNHKFSRN